MAVTNPDSLLDKNGLAYYHSKVKQEIKDATSVTVNVTQSEHQTITYEVPSPYNWYTYTTDGEPSWGDLPSTGATFRPAVPVYLSISADSGFNHGTWVVSGDVLELERPEESYEQTNFEALVFLGETLNVSATPATVKSVRTITLHMDCPALNDDFIQYNESNGTYCYNNTTGTGGIYFNKSSDVTVTAYDGEQLRFRTDGNAYYNQTLTKSDSSVLSYGGSGSNRYRYYDVNGSDETITLKVEHMNNTKFFSLHGETGSSTLSGSANAFTVNYSYVDANTGQTVTTSKTSTTGQITFDIPYTSTGTYTVTLPTGRTLYGSSSSSLTGSFSDSERYYDFWTTNDTSVSTYEMVIGEKSDQMSNTYGYAPNMSTGSITCTAGYYDLSYGGFTERIYTDGMGGYYGGLIGFCDSQGSLILRNDQPAYKIFYNNELIYEATAGQDNSRNVSSLSDAILASHVGQTVTIKVY